MPPILPFSPEELTAFTARREFAQLHRDNWQASAEEVQRAYLSDVRHFCWVRVENGDFSGCNLSGANFSQATLFNCTLFNAYLKGTVFESAWLRRVNLENAQAEGASFQYADLEHARLHGAVLYRANLSAAQLAHADLSHTHMGEANLQRAALYSADLQNAMLRQADLREANLHHALFLYSDLSEANLLDAPGVYTAFTTSLSSRNDTLFGSVSRDGDTLALRFHAGCKTHQDGDAIRYYVRSTYGRSGDDLLPRGRQYMAAIAYLEAAFALDMEAHRWDYLVTWDKDHPKVSTTGE